MSKQKTKKPPEHNVTLRFKTEVAQAHFMGQLSDGCGEGHCSLHWEGDFHEAGVFDVVVWDMDGEEVVDDVDGEYEEDE
jgi:hypothetical protein